MAAKNDITGDTIRTKGPLSKEGQANWDLIFGKKGKPKECAICGKDLNAVKECAWTGCPLNFED